MERPGLEEVARMLGKDSERIMFFERETGD